MKYSKQEPSNWIEPQSKNNRKTQTTKNKEEKMNIEIIKRIMSGKKNT